MRVCAAAGGKVIQAGFLGPFGNLVVVDHGGGLATVYAHLSGVIVREGDTVKVAQQLGYVGDTGRSFGPHLHFEVRVHGSPVDPLVYLISTTS
jgi:murein DD-endopeptidase MepM/ murein hydrolase activator NlpD